MLPYRVGSVVSMLASRAVGRGFNPGPGHTKDHHKNDTNCLPAWHAALGKDFGSATPNGVKGGVVCGTVYGDMHYKYLGSIVKSRVLYPGHRFLSSATWPSLPKKHYN